VGYGSGTVYDPVYGPRRGGVTTTAGVGVGIGGRGDQPGSTDKDRAAVETELRPHPLPAIVYFSLPRNKKAIYELDYVYSQKIVLALN
jgi:hypothetical protein